MKRKSLLAVLLGLLVVGATTGSVHAVVQKPIHPILPSQPLTKAFTGPNAQIQARAFLKGLPVTLTLNFDTMNNITFIGIALRPAGNGAYIPAYYIVQGAKPWEYSLIQRKFTEFAEGHFRAQVSDIKIASSIEPNVNWNYAGSIDYITHTVSYLGQSGYLEFKGFYYYYVIDQNTIEYYAQTKLRGDVSSSAVAVKDLDLHVSRGHTHEVIDDFLPDGHIGPTTSYYESLTVELTPEEATKISASAGYSVNTNDDYYFRIDTHTADPNSYVDFHAYDFKKKSWWRDPPAWGRSFYMKTATTMKTTSTATTTYFGVFKYRVSGEFYFKTPDYTVITKSPEDIDVSVFVYPPHTVFHG
ncbi:hypothetical protein FH039_05325 [Thermococcus indicus]|uniref:Uncharacterized protein n=1 Tax=Thermococcus indicus TaxID=2586643 RepID=A0A4Y5SK19_9EURY|nr:hypothetical protein [Thermococcus indicus]QDA31135.1 hypothetical protein FH039_05325 [Thermococcus indicus]